MWFATFHRQTRVRRFLPHTVHGAPLPADQTLSPEPASGLSCLLLSPGPVRMRSIPSSSQHYYYYYYSPVTFHLAPGFPWKRCGVTVCRQRVVAHEWALAGVGRSQFPHCSIRRAGIFTHTNTHTTDHPPYCNQSPSGPSVCPPARNPQRLWWISSQNVF